MLDSNEINIFNIYRYKVIIYILYIKDYQGKYTMIEVQYNIYITRSKANRHHDDIQCSDLILFLIENPKRIY